jgi:hypothetical protein
MERIPGTILRHSDREEPEEKKQLVDIQAKFGTTKD